ncbi:tyrosine--tRNA ligase [Candidatus Palibaumannia cicadellinicola]|uniref:Tyrosine--tRNA ligase n=1 Tax=Baumannia cicadellinicola subsp. Homalodisca coagulata TaxID=374463 RepID=Q1LU05_BAUCH|nr:tyrosine--tRNA ligase [Candidatus Baumannia cicadellinicola]ABF14277.1 tyrosyl-tRNA synthetase [Baumannia cicadellinicola str. Hc (Homalodisca coagulata)]MCJ7462459.1 tyrosine--tRNA ligase [Candidatus Baumannia cicadellinicola]MCJ7462862.1 tyrosine--tRNA ligase [Candidatus Baumannia cicadellinicola]
MASSNLIQQLQERDLIANITDEKGLAKRLNEGTISIYCGFDPTNDSLHVGHLLPLLCLKRFQLAGHRPIILIGGATSLIGDPSFKLTERKLNPTYTTNLWSEKIKKNLSLFLDFNKSNNSAIIVNNYDWFRSMNILTFLREVGKNFSINQMINKEAIKLRLNRNESGISFAEFSYNLLQGYDFTYLSQKYGVILQIGGSDQWGNILSGIDLTRKIYQQTIYGLTIPLLTKSDGTKFGKTEDNVIWLDPKKTSPYQLYQFWLNTTDYDVYRFLKFFTFMSLAEITAIEKQNNMSENRQRAQYILAEYMTRMIHGNQGLAAAQRITTSLFTGLFKHLTENDFIQLAQDGIPMVNLTQNVDLPQALVAASLAPSYGQARKMIISNAIAINGKKQASINYVFSQADRLHQRYTILQRGKKKYCLLYWQ